MDNCKEKIDLRHYWDLEGWRNLKWMAKIPNKGVLQLQFNNVKNDPEGKVPFIEWYLSVGSLSSSSWLSEYLIEFGEQQLDGHYGLTDWSIDRLNLTELSLYQPWAMPIRRVTVKLVICVPLSVLL